MKISIIEQMKALVRPATGGFGIPAQISVENAEHADYVVLQNKPGERLYVWPRHV